MTAYQRSASMPMRASLGRIHLDTRHLTDTGGLSRPWVTHDRRIRSWRRYLHETANQLGTNNNSNLMTMKTWPEALRDQRPAHGESYLTVQEKAWKSPGRSWTSDHPYRL